MHKEKRDIVSRIKKGFALILSLLVGMGMLSGCGEQQAFSLHVSIAGQMTTLDPAMAVGEANETVILHLYGNLMHTTSTPSGETEIVGDVAQTYEEEVNFDGTVTYTFHLNGEKTWSDGSAVTAADFVYAWRRLADPAVDSPNHAMIEMVQGYEEARSGNLEALAVTAENENTLVITLAYKCPYFITAVCTAPATMPVREEAAQQEGWAQNWAEAVTNGAYQVEELRQGEYIELSYREQEEAERSGPEQIRFYFSDTAEDAYALYSDNTVDFVSPVSDQRTAERMENNLYTLPEGLSTYTVLMNNAGAAFSDARVRQAFSLAIDRNAIAEVAGAAACAARGIVSGGVPESEEESFRACGGDLTGAEGDYAENCDEAKTLFAQAGYGAGATFPEVEYLYVAEGPAAAVAEAVAQMWQEQLGVSVSLRAVSAEELESALSEGSYDLAALDIISPVPDAMGFLARWETGDEHNYANYSNSAFDTLMNVVRSATDEEARVACLHDAEMLLMEDAAVAPLYSVGHDGEMRYGYEGAFRDTMGYWHLESVTVSAT